MKFNTLVRSRFVRFLFVGGSATALQLLILFLLVEGVDCPPVMASSIGYAISAIYNYLLNYFLTFGSSKSHWETFPKFVLVAILGVICNGAAISFFLWLGLYYLIAQFGAIFITLIMNFILHKFWIYRS